MKYFILAGFLFLLPLQSKSDCSAPNEFVCKHFRNKKICSWGNLGCTSQKYFANPGASILNNFRKEPNDPNNP
jgi:hypothetical protein